MDTILEIKEVNYSYHTKNEQIEILRDANYSFKTKTLYAIIGPSGSGKSTTLYLLAGLDAPQGGVVIFNNNVLDKKKLLEYRRKNIGIVFQSFNLFPYMTVLQNVISAMEISNTKIKSKKETAIHLLEKVGITSEKYYRDIACLSGGEQQRVAIARALASDAEIIFADEPTGNLDQKTGATIIELFQNLAHEEDKCIIVVTHSPEFAEASDVIVEIKNKQLSSL